MSPLKDRKRSLKFETSARFQGRNIVVECSPYFVTARLKGQRTAFDVPWDAVYTLGAKLAARRKEGIQ